MFVQNKSPSRTIYTASVTTDLDLVSIGGTNRHAEFVWVNTAGTVALFDVAWQQIPMASGYGGGIFGSWRYVGIGTTATVSSSSADTTPAFTAGDSVTLRFDEGSVFDTGEVVVEFEVTDTTQALVAARINAAMAEAVDLLGHTFVVVDTDEYVLTARAHGLTSHVEVVGFSSAGVGTTLGLSVATTDGTNTSTAAGVGAQWV
jgi:hypothetical protein